LIDRGVMKKKDQLDGWNNYFSEDIKKEDRRYKARGRLLRDVSIQSGPSPDDTGCDRKGTIVRGEIVADKHHRPIIFKYFSEQYNRTVDLPVQDVDFLESIVQRENLIEKEE
tara:strand:+ start:1821 stop:2156 length:336 start_codon:yes stop_codon:yes gene_type:complete